MALISKPRDRSHVSAIITFNDNITQYDFNDAESQLKFRLVCSILRNHDMTKVAANAKQILYEGDVIGGGNPIVTKLFACRVFPLPFDIYIKDPNDIPYMIDGEGGFTFSL